MMSVLNHSVFILLMLKLLFTVVTSTALPRNVYIKDQAFMSRSNNMPLVMSGPNVVVKGPPYLPTVAGAEHCKDVVNSVCSAAGNCTACTTFNQADIDLIKSQGRNMIRLGVTWAGAQPKDEDALDPDFLNRLRAILNLTDKNNIHVMLDNHGDMTASAGCGNGVPMWISQKAAPELIGKPLETGFPFYLISDLRIKNLGGYKHCGSNASKWMQYAGDPNYNLLNECCQAINSGNPAATGYTKIAQANMNYVINKGPGRDAFVRYWKLMAEAVKDHPSAFAFELMNEPMSINRRDMYDTWRATAEEILTVIPDASVAVADTGESAVLPGWLYTILDFIPVPYLAPSKDTVEWMQRSTNLFYAFHWYGSPSKPEDGVKNAQNVGKDWNMPTFSTEFFDCAAWKAAEEANVSRSYWHYSCYCNTGPDFGNKKIPSETFGACILGWGGGNTAKCM